VQITPALAKVLLHTHKWAITEVTEKYEADSQALLVESCIEPRIGEGSSSIQKEQRRQHRSLRSNSGATAPVCNVCVQPSGSTFYRLSCGHSFCTSCWVMHFQVQISQGVSTGEISTKSVCFMLVIIILISTAA
jgi:ariadne-2